MPESKRIINEVIVEMEKLICSDFGDMSLCPSFPFSPENCRACGHKREIIAVKGTIPEILEKLAVDKCNEEKRRFLEEKRRFLEARLKRVEDLGTFSEL